jgi:hypothetical protein
MFTIYSLFLCCGFRTTGASAGLAFFLELVLIIGACVAAGTKRTFAWLGGVDLAIPPLLFLGAAAIFSGLSSASVVFAGPLLWRLAVYPLGIGILIAVRRGWRPPDWFMPVRGRWARRLLAGVGVLCLVSIYVAEMVWFVLTNPRQMQDSPWWTLLLLPGLGLYLYPLWDSVALAGEECAGER